MAEMGFKVYRMSVSWARIYLEGRGEVNPKGIEFYENIIDECLKYGIEPMVTIYHWGSSSGISGSLWRMGI